MKDTDSSSVTTVKIIYVLFLVSVVSGITGLIAVVMAYIFRDDAPDWLQSHFRWQIRTFWIGLVFLVLGSLLSLVLIGWVVIAFWVVWVIIRCIKGLKAVEQREPYSDVETWLF